MDDGLPGSDATFTLCGVLDRPCVWEATDGVAPLTSARLVGVCSEAIVRSKHSALTHNAATVSEAARILCQHAHELQMDR